MKEITTIEDFRSVVADLKENHSYTKRSRKIAGNFITKEKTVQGKNQFTGAIGDFNCFNIKNGAIDLYSEYFQKPDKLEQNWKATGETWLGLQVYESRPAKKVLLSKNEWVEYYTLFNRFVDPEWAKQTEAGRRGIPIFTSNAVSDSEGNANVVYRPIESWVVINFTAEGYVTDVYTNDGPTYYYMDPNEEAEYLARMQ